MAAAQDVILRGLRKHTALQAEWAEVNRISWNRHVHRAIVTALSTGVLLTQNVDIHMDRLEDSAEYLLKSDETDKVGSKGLNCRLFHPPSSAELTR